MAVYAEALQNLYVAYFGRPADPVGLNYWENVVTTAKGDTSAVSAAFAASAEYKARYSGMDAYHVVAAVYMNLFGRNVEPAGLQYWGQNLMNHTMTIDTIVSQVGGGAQGADLTAYKNKVTAATALTAGIDTPAEILGYAGSSANIVGWYILAGVTDDATLAALLFPATLADAIHQMSGGGYTQFGTEVDLTLGIDNLVGGPGNERFNALNLAWSAFDKVDGGLGINTFYVGQAAAIDTPIGATVANIDAMTLQSGSDVTVDASTFGVKTINVFAGGQSRITANASTDVEELYSTHYSSIAGGGNVTIIHSGTERVLVDGAAGAVDVVAQSSGATVHVVHATGAVKVSAQGGAQTAIIADGATLKVSIANATGRAAQLAHIAAASDASDAANAARAAASHAATLVDDLASLKSGVAAAISLRAVAGLTLSAYENSDITRDQKIAIDAAFFTGLSAGTTTAQTNAAALLTASVSGANAASTATALAVVKADAAVTAANTVVSNDTNSGIANVQDVGSTTLTRASITGNFSGSVSLSDGSTLSNKLSKVTLDHAGTALLAGNALTDITMANTNKMVTLNNSAANHTDMLTLSAISSGASGFQDNVASTINIASNGSTSNQLDTFNALSATAINITGAAGLHASMAKVDANAVITATASTGANQISGLGSTQSYLGGSGNDTVTASGIGAQAVLVDGGAGSADRLNVSNSSNIAANATSGAVKFSGFEILGVTGISADVRDFTNSAFTAVVSGGNATINGLNAIQAGAVTVTASGTLVLGLVGATSAGQLDTVNMTASSSGSINIAAPGLAGVETLNLVNSAHDLTITALTSATALTAVNVSGRGALSLTTGSVALSAHTVIDAHAVSNSVMIDAGAATANGLTIIGSISGANTIRVNAAANVATVIVGGDGGDVLTGGMGNDTVTSGNGDNVISAGDGNNAIVSGNGFSRISSGIGNDKITVGSGGNVIDSGAGADQIILAAHTPGVVDDIFLAAAAAGGANMDTITGFVSGQDHLVIANNSTLGGSLTVSGADSVATMLATVTSATSVADTSAVYVALATALAGAHEFAASVHGAIVARAVSFSTGAAAGTYLVINDDTAGFQAGGDIVVKLVGNSTVTAADIIVL